MDNFDTDDGTLPGEEHDDAALTDATEGRDSVPPSSIATAMAGADHPARPSTSFEDVYAQHAKLVWKKLHRSDIAPDAAAVIHQDVFLTLNDQLKKHGLPDSLEAMLSTITGHAICNYLRQRARSPEFDAEVEADELPASSRSGVEQQLVDAERRQLVETLLQKLSGEDAALTALIDLDGMTHAQAAWFFERPLATVRTQHRRAREKLRALAERLYKEDLAPVEARLPTRHPRRREGLARSP